MSTSRTLVAASRPLFRQPFMGTASRQAPFRFAGVRSNGFSTGRTTTKFRVGGQQQKSYQNQGGKRWSSAAAGEQAPSWFKRMWDSPIGLKTVHFW